MQSKTKPVITHNSLTARYKSHRLASQTKGPIAEQGYRESLRHDRCDGGQDSTTCRGRQGYGDTKAGQLCSTDQHTVAIWAYRERTHGRTMPDWWLTNKSVWNRVLNGCKTRELKEPEKKFQCANAPWKKVHGILTQALPSKDFSLSLVNRS